MKLINFILSVFKNYGVFITIACILIGVFGSYAILIQNIKPHADQTWIFEMENRQLDTICFFRVDDSLVVVADTLTVGNKLNLKNSVDSSLDEIYIEAHLLTLNNNPKLLLWIIMMVLMTASACGMLPAIMDEISKIMQIFRPNRRDFVLICIFVIVITLTAAVGSSGKTGILLSGFEIIRKFKILFHETWPPNLIILIVMSVGAMAIFGMLFINFAINQLAKNIDVLGEKLPSVFKKLEKSLKMFLSFVSILVMFSVVTTSLLQQALAKVLRINDFDYFPQEFIYSYGIVFSIFLAAVYIPVYQNLKVVGEKILYQVISSPEIFNISGEDFKQLELNESPLKNIKVLLTILAPILSGLISDVLNHYS